MSYKKYVDNKPIIFALAIFIGLTFIFPFSEANAQRREHLTYEEIEIVREIQSIDYRMLVFIKAIERRFIVLEGKEKLTPKQLKRIEKDSSAWGELPKGTKTQLFYDIDKILDESISKIEDVAERKKKSDLIPIALHILADRAKIFQPKLEIYASKTKSRRETALLNSAIRNCKDIIAAATKIKRPEDKILKKRTKKIDK